MQPLEMEITLRPYQLSDVDHFMEWACDPQVLEFSRIQQWVSPNSSRQDIESYFREVVIPHPWYKAICLNHHPVGLICVEPLGPGLHRGRALLSYALGRRYWGRGIATLATKLAVPAAFRDLPQLVRIEAFVDPENKASHRVLDKVGFLKEGFLRQYVMMANGESLDFFIYSILSSDIPAIVAS